MKKTLMVWAVAVVSANLSGIVKAEMYTFEELAPGEYYSEAVFNSFFLGMTFDPTGYSEFFVTSLVELGPDFSGNCVVPALWSNWSRSSTVVTFDVPVTSFSVTMGDRNVDDDNLYLHAYSTGGNLVDSDYFFNPSSSYAGHTLSVTGDNIARVEFYAVDEGGANSVLWDNVNFTTVPLPGAALLGMIGLGYAGLRLRREHP